MLRWLNPPCFTEKYEESVLVREEGTAEWLFDEMPFLAWKDLDMGQVKGQKHGGFLWVNGACLSTNLEAQLTSHHFRQPRMWQDSSGSSFRARASDLHRGR